MKGVTWSVWILVCLASVNGGRILLMAFDVGYNSRIMDMVRISGMLSEEGHSVSVLINNKDKHFFTGVDAIELFYEYPAPEDPKLLNPNEFLKIAFIQGLQGLTEQVTVIVNTMAAYCRNLLEQTELLQELKRQKFDLFYVDFSNNCGKIIGYLLDVPKIGYSSHGLQADSSMFPNLPSFMSLNLHLDYTDQMGFQQRLVNSLLYWMSLFHNPFTDIFDDIAKEHNLTVPPIAEAFLESVVLAICDPVLDFPRPLFANIKCVGGLNNQPANPPEPELERFMQEAGENGVVLVSFGSMLSRINPPEKADMLARALARLPHKVIWRFTGERPSHVGKNTLIMDWLPQNDILGHPQTKIFVTHCGSHGTLEAAYHGRPVVAIPIYLDQFTNAQRLVSRAGMGRSLVWEELTEDQLYDVIMEVNNNATYRNNALRTSTMLRDRLLSPKDEMLYYVDYVIRHGSDSKLGSKVVGQLSTVQLFSVDVLAVVLLVMLLIVLVMVVLCAAIIKCLLFLCKRSSKTKLN